MLEVKNLNKYYQETETPALAGVSFSLPSQKIFSVFGSSGSGKTTLLKIIAGLVQPSSGEILLDGTGIKGPEDVLVAGHEEIKIVFQDFQLKHMMTVTENINYALLAYEEDYRKHRLNTLLEVCLLEEYKTQYVHQLSGGQKQRVAIARAIANEPRLLLMDEPFSNLDLKAKSSLRDIIKNIVDQTESSVIFVSHDPEEVMMLSDQILIIEAGKITQSGIPSSIYNFPNSISIAEMFSPILKFVISGETSYHRPESIKITKNDYFDLKGQVIGSDYLGKYQLLKVIVNDPIDQLIICPDYQNEYKINDLIKISLTNPLPTFIDE